MSRPPRRPASPIVAGTDSRHRTLHARSLSSSPPIAIGPNGRPAGYPCSVPAKSACIEAARSGAKTQTGPLVVCPGVGPDGMAEDSKPSRTRFDSLRPRGERGFLFAGSWLSGNVAAVLSRRDSASLRFRSGRCCLDLPGTSDQEPVTALRADGVMGTRLPCKQKFGVRLPVCPSNVSGVTACGSLE